MFDGKKAGQRGRRGGLGLVHTPEEPRGGNQREGTLAGNQREEEPKSCKGSLLQPASLCGGPWTVTEPLLRDVKDCTSDGNFIYQNAAHLEWKLPDLLYQQCLHSESKRERNVMAAVNLVWELPGEVENKNVLPRKGNAGNSGLSPQGFGRQIV